jgi:UTP-glucose-1-phosphate uridylyltransferase
MELGRIHDEAGEQEDGSEEEEEQQNLNALNRRLTPQEVEEYKKAGKCFICGKFGHISRNCSQRIKPQAQKQQQPKKY